MTDRDPRDPWPPIPQAKATSIDPSEIDLSRPFKFRGQVDILNQLFVRNSLQQINIEDTDDPGSYFIVDANEERGRLLWFDAATGLFEEAIHVEKSGEISIRAGTAGEVARFTAAGLVSGAPPVGTISGYASTAAPIGYLLCDGAAVSRTTYAALNSLLSAAGYPYGSGDGSTTFNVPNLAQRFPLGKAAAGTGSTLGGTGGVIDHAHTQPTHAHAGPSHTHSTPSHTHTQGDTGSSGSHAHTVGDVGLPNSAAALPVGSGAEAAAMDHSHAVPNTSSTGAHTHTNPTTPSGGDGTSGAGGTENTGTGGGDTTGTNNPPFQVINYIIKT